MATTSDQELSAFYRKHLKMPRTVIFMPRKERIHDIDIAYYVDPDKNNMYAKRRLINVLLVEH